jgi:hypothetical protein
VAHFVKPRLLATTTRHGWLELQGRTQQLLQQLGSELVRSGTGGPSRSLPDRNGRSYGSR